MSKTKAYEVVNRLVEIANVLESHKALYEERDQLVQELQDLADVNQVLQADSGNYVMLVDNFANGNVVYRPAAVSRFEAKVMTGEELAKYEKRRAKAEG